MMPGEDSDDSVLAPLTPPQRRVFLSSVFQEISPDGGTQGYFGLRRTIYDIGEQEGVPVWVAEVDREDLGRDTPWTKNLTACIEVLIDSPLLIVILSHRAGRPVDLGELGSAASSIFEVELFHASQWKVPTVFYVVRGYEPAPELTNLISILRLQENKNWFVLDENEIERHVRSLLRHFKTGTLAEDWALRAIPDRLSDGKSFAAVEQEIQSDTLSFIGRFGPRDRSDFNMRRVDRFLGLARKEAEGGNNVDRLSYLWMAMRDLSIGEAWELARAEKWVELCEQWPSVAAWLGLHGPLNTGVSAAFHTQNDLRSRGFFRDREFPYGPYASEFYSMGLACETPRWQRRRFAAAVQLASRHTALHAHDPSGALAIRASANLRLAWLGRPWLVWSALSDYRRVCRIREKIGADNSVVGEALVESAFAEFQVARFVPWKRTSALARMREGVALLESKITPPRAGFAVRAKRKFALALEQAGFRDEAEAQKKGAAELATRYGMLGQLRQMRDR